MNKTLNMIWLGGNMPTKYQEYKEQWQELNPEWKMREWNEDDIFGRQWSNQKVIDKMVEESKDPNADPIAFYTHVADVVCPEIIYEQGGVYINADIKPLKPIDNLKVDWTLPWLSLDAEGYAGNMAMYSPASNKIFRDIIKEMGKRYFARPGAYMNWSTGAICYQDVLRCHPTNKMQYLPREVFNPLHFTDFGYGQEPDLEVDFPKETIGAHAWGHRSNMRRQTIL